MTFSCGHPRSSENTSADGRFCLFCRRVRNIVRKVSTDQRRINAGKFYNRGERIARGLA